MDCPTSSTPANCLRAPASLRHRVWSAAMIVSVPPTAVTKAPMPASICEFSTFRGQTTLGTNAAAWEVPPISWLSLRGRVDQVVLDGEERGSRPTGDADLVVDMLNVVAGGAF